MNKNVVYKCANNHRLNFGHSLSKRGKVLSPSPTVCLTCHTPFLSAFIGRSAAPNSVFLSRFNRVSKTFNFDGAIIAKFFGNNRC